MKTKIIAWYLPQYHNIPENDEFWGKGFTDWVTVKNARPLFKGHQQPKVPLNNNYYDLSIKDNIVWQSKIAKDYGIFGFGIYHYWFNNEKNLLTKPVEIIYDNQDIDINYFFAWDNASWIRSWSAINGNVWASIAEKKKDKYKDDGILIPYVLGKEREWEYHFNHILHFFKDDRYIKVANKPVFVILQYDEDIKKMCLYWDKLAKKNGFTGIYFIFKNKRWFNWNEDSIRFNYEPHYNGWENPTMWERRIEKIKNMFKISSKNYLYNYDTIWKRILKNAEESSPNEILGAFVAFDDSPRRINKGRIIKGASPAKFKDYLSKLIDISEKQEKDFIFITAWNEWGEGAYLEPDIIHQYEYVNAIKELSMKTF